MVLLGVDAYKRTHTLVAVDEVGCKLAEKSVPATSDGHLEALRWASCWTDRSWAIEVWGANTMSSSSRSRREPLFAVDPLPLVAVAVGGQKSNRAVQIDFCPPHHPNRAVRWARVEVWCRTALRPINSGDGTA